MTKQTSKILDNLLTDLQLYTGKSIEELRQHMEGCREENRNKWLSMDRVEFISANEFYCNDLNAAYQATAWLLRDKPICDIIRSIPESAAKYNWKTVFDYGAGVATPSLVLAELTDSSVAITLGDFKVAALDFARWKATRYNLRIDVQIFDIREETPPIESPVDCVLCIHMIGHSLNPFRTLAKIATMGKHAVWLDDFRIEEYEENDLYPMHQLKPDGWDEIWDTVFTSLGNNVQASTVYGLNAGILAERWIDWTGWRKD